MTLTEPMPLLIQGDARRLPLADESVDLVVNSPPYWFLRSYSDGGQHYDGQIGSEPTWQKYLDNLIECTREMMRALKPSGSIWLNLGDKLAGAGGGGDGSSDGLTGRHTRPRRRGNEIPAKSLHLLPHRYAIRCVDELGLIVRQDQVWKKVNCLSGGVMLYAKLKGRPTTIKVHDLCRHYSPEDVQLWNGDRWTQVVAWQSVGRNPDASASYKAIRAARRCGDVPVVGGDIEIELRSGERIGCTREHRWPTPLGLVLASDLVVGDILLTAPLPSGEVVPAGLDDEQVGWFVGVYIAEGSRSEGMIQIAGHVKEVERYKRLCEIADAYHGSCNIYPDGNKANITMSGNMLRAILDSYVGGRTAKDKFLAPKCWQRSNGFLRAVLAGYLSGDGHWEHRTRRWKIGFTENDALADDFRALGARLGVSVRLRRTVHTGFGKQWPGWRGTIVMDGAVRRRRPDTEIVAIRQSRARQFWDIGVADEPHLFALASGVLTHNSLPESVTDRTRREHEYLFHMVKSPRYYSAVNEVREPHIDTSTHAANRRSRSDARLDLVNGGQSSAANPLGKLPGSVWSIPSQPLNVPEHISHARCCDGQKRDGCEDGLDHYAAFPFALVRPIILGWSPREVCTACGEGRRPVVIRGRPSVDRVRAAVAGNNSFTRSLGKSSGLSTNATAGEYPPATITGTTCGCRTPAAPSIPGVVLDPFGGTASAALVAVMNGRTGISTDASWDYSDIIARWRVRDPKERARAAGLDPDAIARIPVVAAAQGSLWDDLNGSVS